MSSRSFVRRLGIGKLIYLGWYRPRAFVFRMFREGPTNLWLKGRGHAAMRQAAATLPPLAASTRESDPAIYFLTGRGFWEQTLFCASTLLRHAGRPLRVVVLDDGSLGGYGALLLRGLPGAVIVSPSEIDERLDRYLPASRYPTLRQRRIVYPHLRKLTDVHAGLSGWKMVLDSDMLFFGRPAEVLAWLDTPSAPLFMRDVEPSYGYSDAIMHELAGSPVPERLNVGVCGLDGGAIDWDQLEHWCRVMLEREGSSYLHEQALSAMLAAGGSPAVLPEQSYVVRPSKAEVLEPASILHHYVAESKSWYFRFGWRFALKVMESNRSGREPKPN